MAAARCSLCRLSSLAPVGVGVRSCEMTRVANIIRTACKFRALTKQQQRELPETKKVSRRRRSSSTANTADDRRSQEKTLQGLFSLIVCQWTYPNKRWGPFLACMTFQCMFNQLQVPFIVPNCVILNYRRQAVVEALRNLK